MSNNIFYLQNNFNMGAFLYFIIIGALAGWIGSMLFKGRGSGLLLNIIIGIIGGVLGGWLISLLGFEAGSGFVPSLITAAFGAFVLLWIASIISR